MNKLISKIVGVALGITLAVGTGVAIATNGSVSKAVAAETTTTFTTSAANLNYSSGTATNASMTVDGVTITFSSITGKTNSPARVQLPKEGTITSTSFGDSITSITLKDCAHTGSKSDGSFTVAASSDGSTWTEILSKTSMSPTEGDVAINNIASGYKYFKVTDGTARVLQLSGIVVTYLSNGGGGGGGSGDSTGVDVVFTPGVDTGATSVTKQGVTATMTTMDNASYYQIYANQTGTFTSTNGNILKIVFTCTASGTSKYGPGNTSADVGTYTYSGSTGTWTGDAASVTLTSTAQVRMTLLTVTYASSGSVAPTSISCSSQAINVTESVNLSSEVTFAPSSTTETGLSFAIKSGADYITLNTTSGVVTGKKGGSAVVTITPSDTSAGAAAIDVSITVSSISAPGITVGNQYVIYSKTETNGNFELSGVSSDVGTTASFSGEVPACSYVLSTENGFYENTVAFKNGSNYLSLNSNDNKLNTKASIDAESSWIVTWNSSDYSAVLENAGHKGRTLQFNYNDGNSRFACYASSQVAIALYPYVEKALTDFTIDASVSVYKTGTATIGVSYTPADASDKTLTWVSSDTSVATVENGIVTGVEVGTCTVTASKVISGVTVERTCAVTVLNNQAAHLGTSADPFNVNDAVNVTNGVFTQTSNGTPIDLTNTYYYVEGIITKNINRTTSTLSFWIGDDASQQSVATGGFEIFKAAKVYGTNLDTYYTADSEVQRDFNVGYKVKASGKFKVYNGTPEMDAGGFIYYNSYIEARLFAAAFNTALEAVCDADGNTIAADLESAWSSQATAFSALDASEKTILTSANAKTSSNATAVELCAAKYDYILSKYGTTTLSNFMNRTVTPSSANGGLRTIVADNNSVLMIVVVTMFVSATFVGGYFFLRKKKEN